MAKIHPFKAVRPTRDKAQLVSTRPLAAYRKHILRAKLDENPYTFLHIIHPEGDRGHLAKTNSDERFDSVKNRFDAFVQEGILIQDTQPTCYIYRQTKGNHAFTGVIAGASIDEYYANSIKKHEATLTSRETMFTNYLNHTGFNAEPVLLAHEHSDELDSFLDHQMKVRPEYEFSTTDKIKHEVWNIPHKDVPQLQRIYEPINKLYIADGHHRTASSARLKETKKALGEQHFINHDYFLAYLIDEQKLEIIAFNRLVKTLNGLTISKFLDQLQEKFTITSLKKERNPDHEHELICLLDKKAYALEVKPELLQKKDVVKNLDAQLLTDYILSPILGINDLKTSKEIDFIPGTKSLKQLQAIMQKEDFKIGFVLYPIHMDQVKAVADENKIMPPKSTWVEPKMRSGLTIYRINE